jgi:sulfite exporter TauE/SafE
MVNTIKVITGTIPTIMAAGLIKNNLKKRKKKNLISLGAKNIVGVSLIQATAQAGNW